MKADLGRFVWLIGCSYLYISKKYAIPLVMKKDDLILGFVRKLGAGNAALALTVMACVGSMLVYALIGMVTGNIRPMGFFTSLAIPAIIAPFLSYAFMKTLTRLYNSERAYRESEEKFNKLFKASPLPAALSTVKDGVFLAVNDAFTQYFGFSEKEALGASSSELGIWPEPGSREKAIEFFERDGRLRNFEMPYRTKSGEIRRALWSFERIEVEGRPCLISAVNDITERKRAEDSLMESEQALRLSQQKFHKVFQASPAWLSISTLETGEYFDVNDAYLRATGYEKGEVIGRTAIDLGIWANTEERREFVDEIAQKGFARNREIQIRVKSGQTLDMLLSGEKIEIEGRQLILVVAQDITERKQAERALLLSEEKYSKAFQSVPVWIVISTLYEGRYVEVNDAFLQATGFRREEVIGRTSEDLETWVALSQRELVVKKIVEQGKARNLEVRRKMKSGDILDMLFSAELIQIAGESYLLSISQDITELKEAERRRAELEAQLLQAQKMEAIGTLAGGISHDFNNLLQAIQGYTELLLLERDAGDIGFQELQQIKKATSRASELTQQLLTFSRKLKSDFRPVDMNHEVRQIYKILERTIPKNIEIKLNLFDDLWPVKADPGQIEHLIMNMAVNARDAMPKGGVLTVSTENVALDSEDHQHGDHVLLRISDTGYGMDQETVSHIFEPFYTTKPVGQGTGLGLAIAFGIVKSHGGMISCDSHPGKGTTFSIYLPQSKELPTDAEASQSREPFSGSGVTLIVDDEEFLRDLGKQMLSRFGYNVLVAENGESALEIYKKEWRNIDLIVLDLMMPGMGGIACLDELLRINPQAKVIIASGFPVDDKTKRNLQAKARGYVKKPYELAEMLTIVQGLIGS